MDPMANVTEQLEIANEILDGPGDDPNAPTYSDEVVRLAELVLALDEWRRKGGFDPYKSGE